MLTNDYDIVNGLLRRDVEVTRDFFYRRCYPLFKSVYDNYHTNCASCMEFINEIYLLIMTPDRKTGLCKLENFQFRSTLSTWLKTVCLFYCYRRFYRKQRRQTYALDDNYFDDTVRFNDVHNSILLDVSSLRKQDIETILSLMPNRRYSLLIKLRYLEGFSNEETAAKMGMNMNTFYNKHKMAKEQFLNVLRKEAQYGRG